MKRLKIRFRAATVLKVQAAFTVGLQKTTNDRLKVKDGTEMQVNHVRAFVDERLVERCDLTLLGGAVVQGVKYASFEFID